MNRTNVTELIGNAQEELGKNVFIFGSNMNLTLVNTKYNSTLVSYEYQISYTG